MCRVDQVFKTVTSGDERASRCVALLIRASRKLSATTLCICRGLVQVCCLQPAVRECTSRQVERSTRFERRGLKGDAQGDIGFLCPTVAQINVKSVVWRLLISCISKRLNQANRLIGWQDLRDSILFVQGARQARKLGKTGACS